MSDFKPNRPRRNGIVARILAFSAEVCFVFSGAWQGAWGQDIAPLIRQVVEVNVPNDRAIAELERLQAQRPGFEIWSDEPQNGKMTVLIPIKDRPLLDRFRTRLLIGDWDSYRKQLRVPVAGQTFFDVYHAYDDYILYLEQLAAEFPDLAQMFTLGQSVEGRIIRGIRISGSMATYPGFFYHGVQHGNEITNGPVLVYLADYLLRNYDADDHIRAVLDRVELYIVPISNPDGHEAGSRYNDNGIDLNRDWKYLGFSTGFTQPETAALRNFLLDHRNVVWHIDFHTGTQMILWPWGQNTRTCWDYFTYAYIASTITNVRPEYSTRGPIYSTIYPIIGDATDYLYGVLGVASYTIEVSYSYAASLGSLPTYESRIKDIAFYLMEWWVDCDGDGQANSGFDCMAPLNDFSHPINCLDIGGPYVIAPEQCYNADWDNDQDIDLRDISRWMVRYIPME